jgi:hypothetical protein
MHFIKDSWLFPFIQSLHIVGLTLVVGTISIVDLHLLGFGIRRESISDDLAPWTSAGLLTVWVTGPLLFWSDWNRYVNNPAFLLKMGLLSIALLTHFTIHRRATKRQRIAAVLSLVLWSCVVFAGRAIADFDIRAL